MEENRLKCIRKRLWIEFLTVTVAMPIYIIGIIFVALLLIPTLIYRLIVFLIVKSGIRSDLTHPVQIPNGWFALENISEKAKSNIVVCMVIQGRMEEKMEEMYSHFDTHVLNKQDLTYRELKETWTSFMGYFFWRKESNFNLKEHVRFCDFVDKNDENGLRFPREMCTETDVKELVNRLISEPWKKDFSPWEVLVVPNYVPDEDSCGETHKKSNPNPKEHSGKSAIILRFHHAIGDGKGLLQLFIGDLAEFKEAPQVAQESSSKSHRKPGFGFWRVLISPFKLPYDMAKTTVESYERSDNPWHAPTKRQKKYYTNVSKSIDVQRIKDLKNRFHVHYAAILMTIISGAIGRVMKEAGQNVPKRMRGSVALPLPGHPGGVVVHATLMTLMWPVGVEDPIKRLHEVHTYMKSHKTSLFPLGFHVMMQTVGHFPNCLRRGMYNKVMPTILASLFPGPLTYPKYLGFDVIDTFFLPGIPPGQLGAAVSTVVMGGKTRVVVSVDKGVYPSKEPFEKLGDFIEQELAALEKVTVDSFLHDLNKKRGKHEIDV